MVITVLVLFLAGPAVAGPQADSMAFLPFVTGSPPAVPVDSYETDFSDSIEPWKAVRWQKDASYDLDHSSSCDGGHCGFLDFEVNTIDTYAIASPLILGPQPPYDIEFRAKLSDRKDKAQYGVVFGGDWHGAPCPGDNSDGCFNHYYEFRVRYRDVAGDKYLEYRLRRIDGHDGNNVEQGKELVPWTSANGVNAEDWVKWNVHYGSRGHITFKANNSELPGSAEDKKYDDPLYFGVYARAGENGDTEARFDKFSIAKEE
jgi:hypothetical protein